MTVSEELIPPDFDGLNQQFYQEDGPGEYLMMRLHALCVIGGAYESFKDILAEGVEFAGSTLSLVESTDDPDEPVDEADRAFQQHYLRIETHHLKHLAIETLLRLFLGHKDYPECPWFEISKEFNFRKFKETVETNIVNTGPDPGQLQSDVAFVILGHSGDLTTANEEALNYSSNITRFLRLFARDWLQEAKSYNATKHGLTAIPGEANVSIGTSPDRMIEIAYGDRLAHLSTGEWTDGRRDWAVTTRWIRKEQAVPSIYLTIQMLRALWRVARVRYGISEDSGPLNLPSPDFTPEKLWEMDVSSTRELSMSAFTEFKNPPSPTNTEPPATQDAGDARSGRAASGPSGSGQGSAEPPTASPEAIADWTTVSRFVLRATQVLLADAGTFAAASPVNCSASDLAAPPRIPGATRLEISDPGREVGAVGRRRGLRG